MEYQRNSLVFQLSLIIGATNPVLQFTQLSIPVHAKDHQIATYLTRFHFSDFRCKNLPFSSFNQKFFHQLMLRLR